uniref:Uncharacterized protein n=1 Tax=Arundo donax TaxID=35708 RepID=A0A0A9AKC9_ARUDO
MPPPESRKKPPALAPWWPMAVLSHAAAAPAPALWWAASPRQGLGGAMDQLLTRPERFAVSRSGAAPWWLWCTSAPPP